MLCTYSGVWRRVNVGAFQSSQRDSVATYHFHMYIHKNIYSIDTEYLSIQFKLLQKGMDGGSFVQNKAGGLCGSKRAKRKVNH